MKPNYPIVGLVILIFFVISLLTNIIGAILPDVKKTFQLSDTLASFLPVSFFLAYFVMSIPAGTLVERYREKAVLTIAFVMAVVGSLTFAFVPRFGVSLPSLFTIGLGMAMLQVAINPLLRVAGGDQHFSFFSVLAQLVFGVASYFSPNIYSHLVTELQSPGPHGALVGTLAKVVPQGLAWVSIYWVFGIIALVMVVVVLAAPLPKVVLKDDERVGTRATYRELLGQRTVWLYTLGIFAYVSTEQGIANGISEFLAKYHGVDPQTVGAQTVGYFWLLMTVGCLLGLVLLKLMDQRKLLIGAALAAMITLAVALLGPANVSKLAFPFLGFCLSVMWSIIFSLGLNSVPRHHGSFSGILCTAIVGGAFGPFVVGLLSDLLTRRAGMFFIYVPLGYILSIGFWAKPLVNNATIFSEKKQAAAG